ncbi:hypothetical protein AVEN_269559-1 [Araneus ventricosus]|uniref:Uncharacterized protein n=1 Tax=Araneus ventricosus TaxID=182803 RepID=A0A4Y2CCJ0_ARAVE|nr:hypothetical protein AVEN_269559-1 [Araneus ventricosus]
MNGVRNAFHQEARLQIRNPSISTIEESASMSTIEPDLNNEESLSVESSNRSARIELPATTPSFFDADSSRTEIYNVPLVLASEQKLRNVSNGNQSAVARSSKSLEHTSSFPLDPDTPPTPQPPVLPPNFQLSFESQSFADVSKLKPVTSQVSVESQRSADLPKLQPITSTSTAKSSAKSTISKIPVKKPAFSTEDNSPLLAVPSSHMNRRKTFVVDGKVEEPQISLPVSDRRGTVVLSSLADNAESDIISDRRGTFVLSSLPANAKSDKIFDRGGTFVPNSLTDDSKPDAILDRRATYFIPQSKEQPDTSPPKVIETHNPVQNAAPNQTVLLCEDMELTEILPLQNQSHQFIPIVPLWNEKLETKEPGLNEKLSSSVRDQPLCTTSLIKQFPVSNINSSNQLEVSVTHGVAKDARIQNTVSVKKDGDNKSLASNILSKTKLLAETSATNQDVNPTDSQQKSNKETDVEKKGLKREAIDTNIKCSSKKPPSPIAYYAKPDMSIQHKIFESFYAINAVPDKNKPISDGAVAAERDDHKKSTASKDSLPTNQPAVEKVTVKEYTESPKTGRRSGRTQNKCFANFFSDSDESDINFDQDFVPKKRFSLKPGRKIINPNNNKVFVFKKNSKKQSTDKDTPTDSSPNKSVVEDIKNDQEKDIFNFSASSEAGKSPLTKNKKRKSVMPKNNKRSVNAQSDVGTRLSKTTSKRSSKPEINKDEVPVTALPRKSILCLNKCNSPMPVRHSSQFSRKSVRFTLVGTAPQDEINYPKCDSPIEENVTPVNQESDDIHDTDNVSSHNTQGKRLSGKKKCISARSNSLTATGDILKSSSAKSKRSRKRRSCNLKSDSLEDVCESGCSPKKKMTQVSNETPPKRIETHTNLSCGKQEQSKDVKDRFEPSQDISGAISSEVPEEKPTGRKKEKKSGLPNQDANVNVAGSADEVEKTDVNKVKRTFSGVSERRSNKKQSIADELFPSEVHEENPAGSKKEKNSGGILSELPQNLDANVKVSGSADEIEGTNVNKAKRPFSGVSERRSNKKQSIVDDLFPSLDDAICEMVDDNMETAFRLVEDEPTEVYNVQEMAKSMETDCNKGNSVTIKTPKQKSGRGKKKSSKKKSSKQSKDKENTPNNGKFKLDVLTGDNNLCTLLGFKECLEKTIKPKNSRKKKEPEPLLQDDLKADVLTSENAIGSDEAVGGRSRRRRTVMSLKEPALKTKMRRE